MKLSSIFNSIFKPAEDPLKNFVSTIEKMKQVLIGKKFTKEFYDKHTYYDVDESPEKEIVNFVITDVRIIYRSGGTPYPMIDVNSDNTWGAEIIYETLLRQMKYFGFEGYSFDYHINDDLTI